LLLRSSEIKQPDAWCKLTCQPLKPCGALLATTGAKKDL